MRKIIFILIGIILGGIISAQKVSMFRPVPKNLFTKEITIDRTIQGQWLWRISAQVVATELNWNKETKQFVSMPLSSVGPAIGYRHFVALEDGTPYNNFGINGAFLIGTDINTPDPAQFKLALIANGFNFLSGGVCYTLNNSNHWGLLIGASINF